MPRGGSTARSADADPVVREAAVYVTRLPGGQGAVREAIDRLIEEKGLMPRARALYDPAHAPHHRPQ